MRGMVFAMVLPACAAEATWREMEVDRGVPYVSMAIDGTSLTCLVDTGSANDLVTRSDLGLPDEVVIDFGQRESEALAVFHPDIDPLFDALSTSDRTVDCLVGWPVFRRHAVTFDYATASWRVSRSGRRASDIADADLGPPVTVPIFGTLYWPMASFDVAGTPATAIVDTGASFVHLEPPVFDQLDPTPSTVPALATTPDGVVESRAGQLASVDLGGAIQDDVWFSTSPLPQIGLANDRGVELDALVGASFLLHYAVTFDGPRGEVTLQPYAPEVADTLLDALTDDAGV
ncbi:MAG: retropepsin-like aspartic protease, partial [Myxococcota bacterium]